MEKDDDFALINVVRHLKYCVQNTQNDYRLVMQYKYAKPTQPTTGNKKYQQILTKSHEQTMIMNANREMKQKSYVHLKSLTYQSQFRWLHMNIKLLNKKHPIKIGKSQKIDLTVNGQKLSFQSQTMRWNYNTNRMLFRPNYEAVKNNKLFRISLVSQFKGRIIQTKKKVVEMLKEVVSGMKGEENMGQGRKVGQLGFQEEMSFELNKCCSIVTNRVFNAANTTLCSQILEQVLSNQKNLHTDTDLGRALLSKLSPHIQQSQKDLTYQSYFRFSPNFIQQFDDMHEQQIEQLMQKSGVIFTSMFRDPHDFTYQDVVDDLKTLEGYW